MRPVLNTIFSFMAFLMLVSCSQGEKGAQQANTAIPIKTGKVRHVQEREFVSVSGTVVSPDDPVAVAYHILAGLQIDSAMQGAAVHDRDVHRLPLRVAVRRRGVGRLR